MNNCVEYLNNFSREKVCFDRLPEKVKITKSHIKNTVYMSFDTETTNVDNKECITYCCSLMEFGKKIDSINANRFINGDKRYTVFSNKPIILSPTGNFIILHNTYTFQDSWIDVYSANVKYK